MIHPANILFIPKIKVPPTPRIPARIAVITALGTAAAIDAANIGILYETDRDLAERVIEFHREALPFFRGINEVVEGALDLHAARTLPLGSTGDDLEASARAGAGVSKLSLAAVGTVAGLGDVGGLGHTAAAVTVGAVAASAELPVAIIAATATVSVLSIQVHRARKMLERVENNERNPAFEILEGILEPTQEEIESSKTRVEILRERKQNSFAAIVGKEIAEKAINLVYAGNISFSPDAILKEAEKKCYKKIVTKSIKIGLTIAAGTGAVLAGPTHGFSLIVPGIVGAYALIDFGFEVTDKIAEKLWSNREEKRAAVGSVLPPPAVTVSQEGSPPLLVITPRETHRPFPLDDDHDAEEDSASILRRVITDITFEAHSLPRYVPPAEGFLIEDDLRIPSRRDRLPFTPFPLDYDHVEEDPTSLLREAIEDIDFKAHSLPQEVSAATKLLLSDD